MDDNSVDMVLTSPPYDDLRTYQDTCSWNFDVFKPIAKEIYRVLKEGCVCVWVVGDATKDGSESGTSFKQALYFKDECGFKLHDTMLYEKNSSAYPARRDSNRYTQIFEYMFVFSKGKIRDDVKLICDKKNSQFGTGRANFSHEVISYDKYGNKVKKNKAIIVPEFSPRNNIWRYNNSLMNSDRTGHPAVFPDLLAKDHILTWSAKGDLILDPFMGSGTTAKMCILNERDYIGFEKNPEYYKMSLDRLAKYKPNKIMSKILK